MIFFSGNFVIVIRNNSDERQWYSVKLTPSSRPRTYVAALLGSGNTFLVFPTFFLSFLNPVVVRSLWICTKKLLAEVFILSMFALFVSRTCSTKIYKMGFVCCVVERKWLTTNYRSPLGKMSFSWSTKFTQLRWRYDSNISKLIGVALRRRGDEKSHQRGEKLSKMYLNHQCKYKQT